MVVPKTGESNSDSDPYDEDISSFLLGEGFNLSGAESASTDRISAYIPADQILGKMRTAQPPMLSPLPLSSSAKEVLETPMRTPHDVSMRRRNLGIYILAQGAAEGGVPITEDGAYIIRTGFAEMANNGIMHGGGVRRTILGRTPYGNIFVGVQNLRTHHNPDAPIVSVRSFNADSTAEEGMYEQRAFDPDQHHRGLLEIGKLSVNGGFRHNETVSAGFTSLALPDIESMVRSTGVNTFSRDPRDQTLRAYTTWAVFSPTGETFPA